MSDPREKFLSLCAKALSTHSEEEARTCALLAVRLLKKHGIDLEGALTSWQRLRGEIAAAQARALAAEQKIATLEARFREASRSRGAEVPRPARAKRASGKLIRARYSGTCGACGKRFRAGARVFWFGSGSGSTCEDCYVE